MMFCAVSRRWYRTKSASVQDHPSGEELVEQWRNNPAGINM